MAGADDKPTTTDERTVGELSEFELADMMRESFEEDFRNNPERWAAARAEAAELDKARKVIDRAIAIRDGLTTPPWAERAINDLRELTPSLKPSAPPVAGPPRIQPQRARVARALQELFAGEVPSKAELSNHKLIKRVHGRLADDGSNRPNPSRDTILRKAKRY
jgi:hypothetical protein